MTGQQEDCRFFVSYTGFRLPLTLVNAIEATALTNRNTFIRAYFNTDGALIRVEKMVYGEVEFVHRYDYDDNGVLRRAEITMLDEDAVMLAFDGNGAPLSGGASDEQTEEA
jgi:Family of unknown function (DUF6156)